MKDMRQITMAFICLPTTFLTRNMSRLHTSLVQSALLAAMERQQPLAFKSGLSFKQHKTAEAKDA